MLKDVPLQKLVACSPFEREVDMRYRNGEGGECTAAHGRDCQYPWQAGKPCGAGICIRISKAAAPNSGKGKGPRSLKATVITTKKKRAHSPNVTKHEAVRRKTPREFRANANDEEAGNRGGVAGEAGRFAVMKQ